jgi:hypothetical protein
MTNTAAAAAAVRFTRPLSSYFVRRSLTARLLLQLTRKRSTWIRVYRPHDLVHHASLHVKRYYYYYCCYYCVCCRAVTPRINGRIAHGIKSLSSIFRVCYTLHTESVTVGDEHLNYIPIYTYYYYCVCPVDGRVNDLLLYCYIHVRLDKAAHNIWCYIKYYNTTAQKHTR